MADKDPLVVHRPSMGMQVQGLRPFCNTCWGAGAGIMMLWQSMCKHASSWWHHWHSLWAAAPASTRNGSIGPVIEAFDFGMSCSGMVWHGVWDPFLDPLSSSSPYRAHVLTCTQPTLSLLLQAANA